MIKKAVTSERILKLSNFELLFEVHTDASNKVIEGVLIQEEHPIAYDDYDTYDDYDHDYDDDK